MTYSKTSLLEIGLQGQYAGFVSRFIAMIIDMTILAVVIFFVNWFLNSTINMFQIQTIFSWIEANYPGFADYFRSAFVPIFSVFTTSTITFLIISGYYVFFWYVSGQTPGKSILGVRVVQLNGKKMSLWRASFRYLCYFLSAAAFGLGFLWIIFDNRRMGWHDRIAGTCVIYTWEARPDEQFLTLAMHSLITNSDDLEGYLAYRQQIGRPLKISEIDKEDLSK